MKPDLIPTDEQASVIDTSKMSPEQRAALELTEAARAETREGFVSGPSTSAATASPGNAASSPNSKPWATKSPSNQPPDPHTTPSGLRPEQGLPPPHPRAPDIISYKGFTPQKPGT